MNEQTHIEYVQGFLAALAGQQLGENPYATDRTAKHERWREGWTRGIERKRQPDRSFEQKEEALSIIGDALPRM